MITAPWLGKAGFVRRLLLTLGFGIPAATAWCQSPAVTNQAAGATPRLLIVAPSAFLPELQSFVVHKQKLLATETRALESILDQTTGQDDPEKLKRFLYAEWRQRGLSYVLLVGDVDVLPVRYMVLDRITPEAFDYSFYPSDLYFSDLAKADGSFEDWNAQKDSFHAAYFGEVRGEKNKSDPVNYDQVHYLPEIGVGRWPVSTAAEVRLVASKTIAYEEAVLAGTSPHLHRAAFIAVGGWVDSRGLLDRCARPFTNAWQVEKRFYSDPQHPSGTPPPDRPQLRALFSSGIGLAVHTGHGQPDAWEQCFFARDLDRITNSTMLPVVISAGCSTAHFAPLPPYEPYVDVAGHEHIGTYQKEVFTAPPPPPAPYQRGRFNPTGLGENMLKHSANGAVAYIGCNTGSQPCGLTLVEGFLSTWAAADAPHLGDCWTGAIRHYFNREHLATIKPDAGWYPPSIFFQGMKFMLFGDPSLQLPRNRAAK
jgi:hypothetical protein